MNDINQKLLNLLFKLLPKSNVKIDLCHALYKSIFVTLLSEIGDKTFFIAAIMAMRYSKISVFIGALLAMLLMTILSVILGMVISYIPKICVLYLSAAVFLIFGAKMILEGYKMSPNHGEIEYKEAQIDIRNQRHQIEKRTGYSEAHYTSFKLLQFLSHPSIQAFTLTFLTEWGDRSQIATILLATKENIAGIILGSLLGQTLCILLAVYAGRYASTKVSVRLVTITGGFAFIFFGLSTLTMI